MQGKLYSHTKGSYLEMIVKFENRLLFFLIPLVLVIVAFYKQDAVFAIFTVLFSIISYLVMLWHLNSAADNLSSLVKRIVATQP